jgi:hypothetical protein
VWLGRHPNPHGEVVVSNLDGYSSLRVDHGCPKNGKAANGGMDLNARNAVWLSKDSEKTTYYRIAEGKLRVYQVSEPYCFHRAEELTWPLPNYRNDTWHSRRS